MKLRSNWKIYWAIFVSKLMLYVSKNCVVESNIKSIQRYHMLTECRNMVSVENFENFDWKLKICRNFHFQ